MYVYIYIYIYIYTERAAVDRSVLQRFLHANVALECFGRFRLLLTPFCYSETSPAIFLDNDVVLQRSIEYIL